MQIFFIILLFLCLNPPVLTENLGASFILSPPIKTFPSQFQNKYCHDNIKCALSPSVQADSQKRKCDSHQPIDCSSITGCKQCTDNGCTLCFGNYVLDNSTYTCSKKKKKFTTIQIILIITCPIAFLLVINVIIVLIFFRERKRKNKIRNIRSSPVAEDNSNDITKSQVAIGSGSKAKIGKSIISQPLSNSTSLILNQSIGVNSSNSNVLNHIVESNQISIKNHSNHSEKQSDYCCVCHKEKSFICLSCNCGLCYNHYLEYMKEPTKNKICPRHKIKLKGSFYIKINDERKKNEFLSTDKIIIKKPLSKRFDEDLNFKCDCCDEINHTIHKMCDKGCSFQICSDCNNTIKGKFYVCPKCKNSSINK